MPKTEQRTGVTIAFIRADRIRGQLLSIEYQLQAALEDLALIDAAQTAEVGKAIE